MGLGFHSPDNLHILLASSKTAKGKSANSGTLRARGLWQCVVGERLSPLGLLERAWLGAAETGVFLSRLQHKLVQPGSELM